MTIDIDAFSDIINMSKAKRIEAQLAEQDTINFVGNLLKKLGHDIDTLELPEFQYLTYKDVIPMCMQGKYTCKQVTESLRRVMDNEEYDG